jgi:transposase InsO family protein
LVGIDPKTYRYASRRPDDGKMRARLRELATARRRFGYRRLHILLRREGIEVSHKKLFRLYREERPTVKRRQARRIIEAGRIDYNGHRPHTSLDGLTPIEFANRSKMDQNRNRLSL